MILVVPRKKDDLDRGPEPADLFGSMEDVEPGHVDVEYEDVRTVPDNGIDRFRSRSHGIDKGESAFLLEDIEKKLALARVVIGDDD